MITEVDNLDKVTIDRTLKDELTKDLSPNDLSKIKKGFDLYKGVVNLQQFIIIMIQALYNKTDLPKRKLQILTFIEMFLLIDLKNLQKIKFEDFTNYLIDRQANKLKVDEYQLFPCENLNDLNLQGDSVYPLTNCPNFAILDSSKKQVALIEPKNFKKSKSLSFGGFIINNIIYLEDQEVYCIATNDKHLNFYQTTDDTLVRRFQIPDTIHFLLYISQNGVLITGSTNGHIYEWSTKKILANLKKNQKGGHDKQKLPKTTPQEMYKLFMLNKVVKNQSDLTCIDYMHSLEILITGCNDSLVRLYEVRSNGLKMSKELDGHYKGIKGITVSQQHKIIVSCSFDFDVLVWNAYLQHPIARLQGHQAPLMSVYCPKKYDIIISLDSKSVLKIWSSQKFHLIQNVVIFESCPVNSSIRLCYKQESNFAIVYTKKLLFYKYSVNYNPKLTDDHEINAIQYSKKNLQVYIGSYKSLKIWSIEQGIQKRSYINVTQSEITVLELDERHRRCFIGCINGQIVSLDLFSGLVIQSYSSHKSQISFLHYNFANNLLISGSWDRKIKIHNDTHHLEKIQSRENVLRTINNIGEKDLSGGSFNVNQFLIATHCKTNAVYIWDFQKCYLEARYLFPADVCQAQFICPYPLLLVSDVKGSIYIVSTKNHTSAPYKLLAQWKNMYSIQKSSQITYIKPVFDQKTKQCQIILGDEYGYIRVVSLTNFIQVNKINPVTPEMLGNKNPYRIQDYNYKGGSESSSNCFDFSNFNCSNLVPPSTIKQKIQMKAHGQKINYVTFVNESQQQMILSASSDHLVKMWSCSGEQRGVLKQGLRQNQGWQYNINQKWQNNEAKLYDKIKNELQQVEEDYLFRKRMDSVPFTVGQQFEEASNEDIYNDLKQIDSYLHKNSKQPGGRLY